MRDSLRGMRKFSEGSPRRRRGRGVKNFLIKIYSELCELRVSAVNSLFPFWLRFAALAFCRQRIDPLAHGAAADFSDHAFQFTFVHPDAATLIAAVQRETVESVAL